MGSSLVCKMHKKISQISLVTPDQNQTFCGYIPGLQAYFQNSNKPLTRKQMARKIDWYMNFLFFIVRFRSS